jgi:hypothetical protein
MLSAQHALCHDQRARPTAGRRATQPTCIDGGTGVDVMILLISDTQVRKVFDKLRAEDPAMWHVVDASMSLDDVTAKVVTFPANA